MLHEWIVVCRLAASAPSISPCYDQAGAAYAPVMIETDLLSPGDGAAVAAWAAPVDFTQMGQFFAYSFSIVVVCCLVAWAIGQVVGGLKNF